MAFNHCMKMAPMVMSRRLAAPPVLQQARSIFTPWRGPSDIGALIRDMDRQMDRLERQMFRQMPSLFSRATALPIDDTLSPHDEAGGQYRVSVDLAGFKPEEINLALDEATRRLTISAKCERKGRDGSRYAHEMVKTVTLPETIDLEHMTSLLNTDGVLAIDAPYKEQPPKPVSEPRTIPISRVGAGEQKEAIQDKTQDKAEETTN